MLPAGLRQKDQTQKAATGPFDREHLLMYLEKEALEQKDREDFVPFTGEKKGKERRSSPGVKGHRWGGQTHLEMGKEPTGWA